MRFVVVWTSNGEDGSNEGVFGQRACAPLTSVTIAVDGSTTICPTGVGGTASVMDEGGGPNTHAWAWRPMGGMSFTPIGATGATYQIQGAHFNGGAPGFYELACNTTPTSGCGSPMFSNTIQVVVSPDLTSPMVMPPPGSALTQTLCQ